jgi:hypothetical protein
MVNVFLVKLTPLVGQVNLVADELGIIAVPLYGTYVLTVNLKGEFIGVLISLGVAFGNLAIVELETKFLYFSVAVICIVGLAVSANNKSLSKREPLSVVLYELNHFLVRGKRGRSETGKIDCRLILEVIVDNGYAMTKCRRQLI